MGSKHTTSALVCLLLTAPLLSLGTGATQAPGSWTGAALLEFDDTGSAFDPRVAASADGTAIAAWVQYTSAYAATLPFVSRYDPVSGWSAPVSIATDRLHNASMPAVTMDARGNGAVVWVQDGTATTEVWAAFYSAGSGWSPAAIVDTADTQAVFEPDVALARDGTAIVVWDQYDNVTSNYRIWSRLIYSTFWAPPVRVENGMGSCFAPLVEANDFGDLVVVYTCDLMLNFYAYAAHFEAATGEWFPSVPLSGAGGFLVGNPRLAMDATGNATAVWSQQDQAGSYAASVFEARWTRGYFNESEGVIYPGTWGSAVPVENLPMARALEPVVGVDADGRAYVAWTQDDSPQTVWMNQQSAPGSWGTPTQISPTSSRESHHPAIAVNARGYGVVAYDQGGYKLAGTLEPTFGWNCCNYVDHATPPTLAAMAVAVDTDGNGFVVMAVTDDLYQNIHAVRYAALDYTGPSLTVEEPVGDGTTYETDRPYVTVAGHSDAFASVSVGGQTVVADAAGAFSILTELQPGLNDLLVVASDASGNSVQAYVSVKFNDPMPGLLANLTAAQGQVTDLGQQLNQTNGDLLAAQAALLAAEMRLVELEASGSATQADLDAARTQLTEATDAVASLEGQQVTLASLLDDATADLGLQAQALAAAQGQVAALTATLSSTRAALNATNASLAEANGRIDSLEAAPGGATQAQVDAANAGASTATLVAVLGVLIGGAAMGTSIMMGRRGGGGGGGGGSGGSPNLHTAAHEAAHVVQQRGGKPEARQGGGEEDGGSPRASQQAQAAARPAGDKGGGSAGGGQGPADHGGP